MSETTNENYGYLIIDTPDKKVKFAPIQKSDEYESSPCNWYPTGHFPSGGFSNVYIYRRPLVPESSEWELVLWDSIATPGDYEHTGSGEEWVASSVQIGKPIKRSFDASVTIAIRRRRTQPTQWISVRERLPIEIDYPMWVFCGDVVADSLTHYADSVERPEVHGWSTARELAITHFCPKPKQEPPPLPALPPPTSASEKAFEGWHDSTKAVLKCSKDEARAIWFAGFSTKDKI